MASTCATCSGQELPFLVGASVENVQVWEKLESEKTVQGRTLPPGERITIFVWVCSNILPHSTRRGRWHDLRVLMREMHHIGEWSTGSLLSMSMFLSSNVFLPTGCQPPPRAKIPWSYSDLGGRVRVPRLMDCGRTCAWRDSAREEMVLKGRGVSQCLW